MAVYTAGRRRTMLILLLTSVMLITIDLRGNALLDGARSGFDYAFRPFEVAAEVVSRPVERAWAGITEVDDLRRENEALRRELDGQRSDQIVYRNALAENQDLRALNSLESLASYDKVTCSSIGSGPSNFSQVVEIDCGTIDGLRTGMPVVNEAGLVGRVTQTFVETSIVRLITDAQYHVEVKVVSETAVADDAGPPSTSPSGLPLDSLPEIADDLSSTTSTSTTTTSPFFVTTTTTTVPPSSVVTDTSDPTQGTTPGSTPASVPGDDTGVGTTSSTSSTTTTTIPRVPLETGVLDGMGSGRLPRVRLIADSPAFGRIQDGDQVLTTGGRNSFAPPNIPIGVVANRIDNLGTEGQHLEIEPSADLSRLNFLTVILYQPPTELGGG